MQTFSIASYWAMNERGRNGRTNSEHREDKTGVPYRHNNGLFVNSYECNGPVSTRTEI